MNGAVGVPANAIQEVGSAEEAYTGLLAAVPGCRLAAWALVRGERLADASRIARCDPSLAAILAAARDDLGWSVERSRAWVLNRCGAARLSC